MSSDFNEKYNQTVTNTIRKSIRNDDVTYCLNIVTVSASNNCTITGANQTCEAIALTNSSNNPENITPTIKDEQIEELKNNYERSPQVPAPSGVSSIQRITTQITVDTLQSFFTDCSKTATGFNLQAIRDCNNSTVNFGDQGITVSSIGNCAVNSMLSDSNYNLFERIVTGPASSRPVNLIPEEPEEVAMYVILVSAALLIAIFSSFALRSALTPTDLKQSLPFTGKLAIVFMVIGCISFVIWWPGLIAFQVGMYPYRDATAFLSDSICSSNVRVKKGDIVNEMFWWDDDELKHYEGCGLIGGGCQDPQLADDLSNYVLAANACEKNGGHSIPKEGVDVEALASKYFDESYPGCKKCSSGLFAVNSGDCSDTDRLSFAVGPDDTECADDEEDYCYTYQELQNEHSGECLDKGYQARKRPYSYSYRFGEELNDVKDALSLFLGDDADSPLCPPNPYTYLTKCNPSTGKCSYNAQSEETEMSCKNDFTDCENPEYLTDLAIYDSLIDECNEIEAEYDRFHPWGWIVGVSVVSICAIMVIGLSIYSKMNPGKSDNSYETNNKFKNGTFYAISRSLPYLSLVLLLVVTMAFTSVYAITESFGKSAWVPLTFGVIGFIISVYLLSKISRIYFKK